MKNTADNGQTNLDTDRILRSPQLLKQHLTSALNAHRPRSYIYEQAASTPAAVLLPLFFKDGQAHLLFTMRTDLVEHHKGQISFPGGKQDAEDQSLRETALRETEEEVGLHRDDIELLGRTDSFLTNTHFLVTPFVGLFAYPYDFVVSDAEIERLIEVPLLHLLRDDVFEVKPFKRDGYTWMLHYYKYKDDTIWGVTGFLLSNFLSIVFGKNRNLFTQPGIL